MDLCAEVVRVDDHVILRPLMAQDAGVIAAGLSDWGVTQWLTHVPFPYAVSDAEWFLGNDLSRGAMGLIVDGAFAGVVQIGHEDELGYWLAPAFHGQGIMTRAAEAAVGQAEQRAAAVLETSARPATRSPAAPPRRRGTAAAAAVGAAAAAAAAAARPPAARCLTHLRCRRRLSSTSGAKC